MAVRGITNPTWLQSLLVAVRIIREKRPSPRTQKQVARLDVRSHVVVFRRAVTREAVAECRVLKVPSVVVLMSLADGSAQCTDSLSRGGLERHEGRGGHPRGAPRGQQNTARASAGGCRNPPPRNRPRPAALIGRLWRSPEAFDVADCDPAVTPRGRLPAGTTAAVSRGPLPNRTPPASSAAETHRCQFFCGVTKPNRCRLLGGWN